MPEYQTRRLGTLRFEPHDVIEFPRGLPGFDHLRRFALVRIPKTDPLVYLQSLEDPAVCFLTAPMGAVDPDYRLEMDPDDVELVGLPPTRRPVVGKDVCCLAVLAVRESGPTANLLAPVVLNLRNRKAVQAVSQRGEYSHRHTLGPGQAAVCS
jgi:flagellar assembly factor FliW